MFVSIEFYTRNLFNNVTIPFIPIIKFSSTLVAILVCISFGYNDVIPPVVFDQNTPVTCARNLGILVDENSHW